MVIKRAGVIMLLGTVMTMHAQDVSQEIEAVPTEEAPTGVVVAPEAPAAAIEKKVTAAQVAQAATKKIAAQAPEAALSAEEAAVSPIPVPTPTEVPEKVTPEPTKAPEPPASAEPAAEATEQIVQEVLPSPDAEIAEEAAVTTQEAPVLSTEQPVEQAAPPEKMLEPQPDVAPEEVQIEEEVAEIEEDALTPEEEFGAIDTLDLPEPQGNWVYKLAWWQRAEAKYEKIRALVASIAEARLGFFAARAEIDKNVLDPFYLKIGFNRGELTAHLNALVEQLEKKKGQKGVAEQLVTSVNEEIKLIEKLQSDIEAVNQLDNSLDEALAKLMEQMNKVRSFEQEAWNAFKEIARVLDDNKARELYYQIEVAARNIKDLQKYLNDAYAPSFNEISSRIVTYVSQIESRVAALGERGVNLKISVQQLKEPMHQPEDEEDEEEIEPGFIERWVVQPALHVWDGAVAAFQFLGDIIAWPFKKLFKSEDAVDDEEEESIITAEDAEKVGADTIQVAAEEAVIDEIPDTEPEEE